MVPEFFWRNELEASTSVFKETVRVDYWQRENAGSGLLGLALFNHQIETREVYHYLKVLNSASGSVREF